MRRLAAIALLATLAFAAPAHAGATTSQLSLFTGSGTPSATTPIPARVSGAITVQFSADAATGCSAFAQCAYSGRIVAQPAPSGQLLIGRLSHPGRISNVTLLLGSGLGGMPREYTLVQRRGGGRCADEQSSGLTDSVATGVRGRTVTLALTVLTATRCAGPLPRDLDALLPRVTLASSQLAQGNRSLDFHTTRSFATGGFTGILTSTIVLRLGRPGRPERVSTSSIPAGIPTERDRVVSERLTLEGASGSIATTYSGSAQQEACVLLDTCGLTGTLTITPRPSRASVVLIAQGPASRPMRDFRAALGLGGGGRAAGISVFGGGQFPDRGTLQASTEQAAVCRDDGRLTTGTIIGGGIGPRLFLGYYPTGFGGDSFPHTRCPGPLDTADTGFAGGTVPTGPARMFTVLMRGGGAFEDDGYTAWGSGTLRLRFRRGPLRSRIEVQPQ